LRSDELKRHRKFRKRRGEKKREGPLRSPKIVQAVPEKSRKKKGVREVSAGRWAGKKAGAGGKKWASRQYLTSPELKGWRPQV